MDGGNVACERHNPDQRVPGQRRIAEGLRPSRCAGQRANHGNRSSIRLSRLQVIARAKCSGDRHLTQSRLLGRVPVPKRVAPRSASCRESIGCQPCELVAALLLRSIGKMASGQGRPRLGGMMLPAFIKSTLHPHKKETLRNTSLLSSPLFWPRAFQLPDSVAAQNGPALYRYIIPQRTLHGSDQEAHEGCNRNLTQCVLWRG